MVDDDITLGEVYRGLLDIKEQLAQLTSGLDGRYVTRELFTTEIRILTEKTNLNRTIINRAMFAIVSAFLGLVVASVSGAL